MVFLTVALVSLYTLVLPFLSLYIFKLYDAPQYYRLSSYYHEFATKYLPQSSLKYLPSSPSIAPAKSGREFIDYIWEVVTNVYEKSAIYRLYEAVISNDKFIELVEKARTQSAPFYHNHILPLTKAFRSFELDLLLRVRPYYTRAAEIVIPKLELLKESYIGYFDILIEYLKPFYHTTVKGYIWPFYSKYVYPQIEEIKRSHYKYVYPFYLEHEDTFSKFGQGIINFLIGVLIFKLFEKQISKVLELVLSDIYEVKNGLEKNYSAEGSNELNNSTLIDPVSDAETLSLLKSVRDIDSMRPLDTIVDHEKDFSGILNSSSTSFSDDSPTKVDIPARHPYSQKTTKKGSKSKKGKQIKKDVDDSFLDSSLANGIPGQNDHHAHLCAQVQVQVINENGDIEIQEDIEDELAGKGMPNGEENDEDEGNRDNGYEEDEKREKNDDEEEDDDDDEQSGESQSTEEMIRQKLASVSDDSSDLEEPGQSKLPKILTNFSTPSKYNTGIFYSSSRNGLITAAIPLTPSPTKAAFGVLFDETKERSSSPHTSIMSSSSVKSQKDNDLSILSITTGASLITNPSPAKISTACVSEETIYVTNGEAGSLESRTKKTQKFFGTFNSNGRVQMRER